MTHGPKAALRRKLPVNLRPEDLWLFEYAPEYETPPAGPIEIENVRASADGLLFKGGRILPESFVVPANLEQWKKRSVVKFLASNYLLRKRRRLASPAAWVIDDWSGGYYHWFADTLPRLYTIRDRIPELVLLFPHRYEKLGFARRSLEAFGVKKLEFIKQGEVVLCQKLVVPAHTAHTGNHDDEVLRGVRDILVRAFGKQEAGAPERVYISRGKAPIRRVKNEEEVLRVLREFDFEVFHFEDYTFEEQVKIAANARHLVSSHGAGLTNMLFMSPGRSVMELRNRTDAIDNCYFTMASALNLNYYYQACEPENSEEDPHSANLLVDAEALKENLSLMLGS
ncbi:MAG TPA: glycosyltransferase family 61 protein [Pyrinomonadaceae bacterium]|nr:glycosyltransferase family 61 protein [Pyrinomonadaceae bacterium]